MLIIIILLATTRSLWLREEGVWDEAEVRAAAHQADELPDKARDEAPSAKHGWLGLHVLLSAS